MAPASGTQGHRTVRTDDCCRGCDVKFWRRRGHTLNRPFSNLGTSSVQTFGDVLVVGMSGSISNSGHSLLNSGLSFAATTGSSATFTNSGVLRKPANGFSSQLALPLINSGQVEVLNSELILKAGGTNTGIIAISEGATLSLSSGSFIK